MTDLTKRDELEDLEAALLDMPQVECPVFHRFGPGIYIREVHMPAGTLAMGHGQRFEHTNILLQGKVAVIIDGVVQVLEAPLYYVGKPGRKFGYVIEDVIWQNIYATDETDVDKLEEMFLDKSATWHDHNEAAEQIRCALHVDDRYDYEGLKKQLGITEEQIRAQSEDEKDQVEIPKDYAPKVTIRDSYIEGKGVFLSAPAEEGEVMDYESVFYRTPPYSVRDYSDDDIQ